MVTLPNFTPRTHGPYEPEGFWRYRTAYWASWTRRVRLEAKLSRSESGYRFVRRIQAI